MRGVAYAKATIDRRELAGAFAALHERVDIIATLVVPQPIPTVADFGSFGEKPDDVERLVHYTSIADLTGNPTISLPAGFDGNGAPLGIQFMGPPLGEETLCRAGYVYQQAHDWAAARPDIAGD